MSIELFHDILFHNNPDFIRKSIEASGLAEKLFEIMINEEFKNVALTSILLFDSNKDDKVHKLAKDLLDKGNFDYAVDCIDTLSPKSYFIKACIDRNIPIISSMGAGGKINPLKVTVTDISKTHQCNLAFYVRRKLRSLGIKKGVKVVFSAEEVDQEKIIVTEKAHPKTSSFL